MIETEKHGADRRSQEMETTRTGERRGPTPITHWPWLAQLLLVLSIFLVALLLLMGLPRKNMIVTTQW